MRFSKMLAVAALAAATFAASAATITIDTFNTSGPVLTQNTIGSSLLTAQSGPGMIGGAREMRVSKIAGVTAGNSGKVNFEVSDGVLDYNSGNAATGMGYIRWDGLADGLEDFGLNANMTGLNVIEITSPFSDGGFSFNITLWNSLTQYSAITGVAAPVRGAGKVGEFPANHTFSFFSNWFAAPQAIVLPPNPFFPAGFNFTSTCGADGCVNFADVDAITSEFGGTQAIDFTITSAQYKVAEPGSLALTGLGLLGVGFLRKRKQK
jgi:hypothetical protein